MLAIYFNIYNVQCCTYVVCIYMYLYIHKYAQFAQTHKFQIGTSFCFLFVFTIGFAEAWHCQKRRLIICSNKSVNKAMNTWWLWNMKTYVFINFESVFTNQCNIIAFFCLFIFKCVSLCFIHLNYVMLWIAAGKSFWKYIFFSYVWYLFGKKETWPQFRIHSAKQVISGEIQCTLFL